MAHLNKPLEIHYRLTNMPNIVPPAGSVIHYELSEVNELEDGAIEMVMRYLDHDN